MSDMTRLSTCRIICWGLAVIVGMIVLWGTGGAVGVLPALMLAAAFTIFFGLVLIRLVCTGDGAGDKGIEMQPGSTRVAEGAGGAAPEAKAPPAPAAAEQPKDQPASASEAPAVSEGAKVRGGTLLEAEQELAERKGTWRYGAADTAATTTETEADATTDATRPQGLPKARGGQVDDLKQIKGVGPKLESMLNDLGIFHFDQVAGWGEGEVAWLDSNLKGFRGRVSRDNWVEQARILAEGGETEFSARVQGGDVYKDG